MRRKRVSQGASRASSSKRSSAAGSRSMQTSLPAGPRRSARSRAWPPAPKVQSTTVSPTAGAVKSISSPASTGTCVRVMSRRMAKPLRHFLDLGVERLLLGFPALAAPDLEVVAHSYHHHFLLDRGVTHQGLRQGHPPRAVELDFEGVALVEASQLAVLRTHRVQPRERALDDRLVAIRRPYRHAGLGVLGQNH